MGGGRSGLNVIPSDLGVTTAREWLFRTALCAVDELLFDDSSNRKRIVHYGGARGVGAHRVDNTDSKTDRCDVQK